MWCWGGVDDRASRSGIPSTRLFPQPPASSPASWPSAASKDNSSGHPGETRAITITRSTPMAVIRFPVMAY